MRLLFALHGYPPVHNAGAETTAHSIAKWMVANGCTVQVFTAHNMLGGAPRGELDGVEIICQTTPEEEDEAYARADVVLTHLNLTRRTADRCNRFQKPLVHLVHNPKQLAFYNVKPEEAALLVFNSLSLLQQVGAFAPSLVVHPPLFPEDYDTSSSEEKRTAYTLINLNANKGGALFWQLARSFPDRHFIGVMGAYDEQILEKHPPANVEILNQSHDLRPVFARTLVQLMPSLSETWGRAALEAACSGIPVIANRTPGLAEALGNQGAVWADRQQLPSWEEAITLLDNPDLYRFMSRRSRQRSRYLGRLAEVQLEALLVAFQQITNRRRSKVFVLASEPHYAEHLAAIWHALPPASRGTAFAGDSMTDAGSWVAVREFARLGVPVIDAGRKPEIVNQRVITIAAPAASGLVVASPRDREFARQTHLAERVIRIEHGAGQTYQERHPSFAGGQGHDVMLSLVPGQQSLHACRQFHPNVPVQAVGCPRLDFWHLLSQEHGRQETLRERPIVAFTFRNPMNHFHSKYPELASAFPEFRQTLQELAEKASGRWELWGHGHPRAWSVLAGFWESIGVRPVQSLVQVFASADVLVGDNSSALFEFASLGKPIVLLDSQHYRRWVHHGMRFWELADLGPRTDDPGSVEEAIELALSQSYRDRAWKLDWSLPVYSPAPDGSAGLRAVSALLDALTKAPGKATVLIEVLQTCHNEMGLLRERQLLWVSEERARELEERNLAVIRTAGELSEVPSTELPSDRPLVLPGWPLWEAALLWQVRESRKERHDMQLKATSKAEWVEETGKTPEGEPLFEARTVTPGQVFETNEKTAAGLIATGKAVAVHKTPQGGTPPGYETKEEPRK